MLDRLAVTLGETGVALGLDPADRPVLLDLFRPEPTRVAFVGGWWAAQVLVFRCLGHGASVSVEAVDAVDPARTGTLATAAHWLALDEAAGGTGERVVWRRSSPGGPPASARRPELWLRDVGATQHDASARGAGPWPTQLTMLPQLTAASLAVLAGVDLLLVQRLSAVEAELLASSYPIDPGWLQRLTTMDNDMVAALGGGAIRLVRLMPTATERRLFG
ncbi:hypothetical protein Asi02nite_32910 [Asanoa siamensis]|uniref:TIGR03089 family protein n=1 Tax=Asanoa siamensis TaxID=926357 RepID=A0ABQ4CR49_9ACTN|nr:hypothetical protein Asi02nite_32910 [Asanoa siamensis]